MYDRGWPRGGGYPLPPLPRIEKSALPLESESRTLPLSRFTLRLTFWGFSGFFAFLGEFYLLPRPLQKNFAPFPP